MMLARSREVARMKPSRVSLFTASILSVFGALVGCSESSGVCGPDRDGDGIADTVEGRADPDADGTPNDRDRDSDGDGTPDRDEAGASCEPADTDRDGVPDFLDLDSDDDRLADARERELGTSLLLADTDSDGVSDAIEVDGSATDPLDASSTIGDSDVVVALKDASSVEVTLSARTSTADVFFLFDITGSMIEERDAVVEAFTGRIVPELVALVPDLELGVGSFADYPVLDHGGRDDRPFTLVRAMAPATDARAVLRAIESLPVADGRDVPESLAPALYSLASGRGLTWTGGSLPDASCPDLREGYACFRPKSLPVIVVVTDAPANTYEFDAPDLDDAIEALNARGARVITLRSGLDELGHHEAIASGTGTVDADGAPIVLDVPQNGEGIADGLLAAITTLLSETRQPLSVELDGEGLAVVRGFTVEELRHPTLMDGFFVRRDGDRFEGVLPSAELTISLDLGRAEEPLAPVAVVRVQALGHGGAHAGSSTVYVDTRE